MLHEFITTHRDEIITRCGAKVDELFRPFEQRGIDRTGLGLGLAFCRWGADANGGRIYVRNFVDRGCVFTLELPRMAGPCAVVINQ